MTLADILKASSNRILDNAAAADYVGGQTNLNTLHSAGYVRPWKQNNKVTQWDVRDLDTAIDRVKLEGWPATP